MTRLLLASLVAVLLLCGRAGGQTTQPAEQWPATVAAMAKALADGDGAGLAAVASESIAVRAFDSKAEDAPAMLTRTRGSQVVCALADKHEPLSLAASIAAAVKVSPFVPDHVRKQLIPENEAMARANATAVQWLATELAAKTGDYVGVIVLWTPRADTLTIADRRADSTPERELVFVLVKGVQTPAKDFKVRLAVFGNPLPIKS